MTMNNKMPKYINADELTEYLADDCFTWRWLNDDRADEVDSVIKAIAEMPAADVVEVKHGEWVGYNFDFYCSNCNRYHTVRSNFCPHCGADMRGEQNERK